MDIYIHLMETPNQKAAIRLGETILDNNKSMKLEKSLSLRVHSAA